MLVDPAAMLAAPLLVAMLLAVVLVAKPLTALVIVWLLGYSWQTALTIAIALAQIGEFSFLLADAAEKLDVLSPERHSLLVACAMISITLNPLWFRAIGPIDRWFRARPRLWRIVSGRSEAQGAEINRRAQERLSHPDDPASDRIKAVIVGYGPVGQTAARILSDFDIQPVVVDLNVDTVRSLSASGNVAVFGDATRRDILEAAAIADAKYLLVTVPDVLIRTMVIIAARELNPELRVFARARYLKERAWLEEVGATQICIEEAETAAGLTVLLLQEVGADVQRVRDEINRLHHEFGVQRPEVKN
jgi:CPA2 family monovalent cation:H+ antiporter-2